MNSPVRLLVIILLHLLALSCRTEASTSGQRRSISLFRRGTCRATDAQELLWDCQENISDKNRFAKFLCRHGHFKVVFLPFELSPRCSTSVDSCATFHAAIGKIPTSLILRRRLLSGRRENSPNTLFLSFGLSGQVFEISQIGHVKVTQCRRQPAQEGEHLFEFGIKAASPAYMVAIAIGQMLVAEGAKQCLGKAPRGYRTRQLSEAMDRLSLWAMATEVAEPQHEMKRFDGLPPSDYVLEVLWRLLRLFDYRSCPFEAQASAAGKAVAMARRRPCQKSA